MPAGPGHCPVAVAQVLGVAGASRISTQARAMSESLDLVPGMTAKPLFSTTVVRSHVLALASSAILAGASPWARKRSAQNGASATTVALCAATPASLRAVEPVTHAPQGALVGAAAAILAGGRAGHPAAPGEAQDGAGGGADHGAPDHRFGIF